LATSQCGHFKSYFNPNFKNSVSIKTRNLHLSSKRHKSPGEKNPARRKMVVRKRDGEDFARA